jgi:hypothetical protein
VLFFQGKDYFETIEIAGLKQFKEKKFETKFEKRRLFYWLPDTVHICFHAYAMYPKTSFTMSTKYCNCYQFKP